MTSPDRIPQTCSGGLTFANETTDNAGQTDYGLAQYPAQQPRSVSALVLEKLQNVWISFPILGPSRK